MIPAPPKSLSGDLQQLGSDELLEAIQVQTALAGGESSELLHACGVALAREMSKSQQFLDAVETIIVGLDREGCVTLINRRGCELLGYDEGELLGKFWFSTCLPEGSEAVYDAFQSIMKGQIDVLDYFENEVRTRSGERRVVAWRNSFVRGADGAIVGTLSAGEDITERKRVEERSQRLFHENRRLMQRLFQVQEAERRRLARELHDELGQWLSAVQAHAQLIADLSGDEPRDIRESAGEITASIDAVLQIVRRMIRDLRPVVLDALGLEESLEELVTRWRAQHAAISCRLVVSGRVDDLGEPIAIVLYRTVQEALTNVARYAKAQVVRIRIRRLVGDEPPGAPAILLEILDDGQGMDPGKRHEGMGLVGMRERVLMVGGSFELVSRPGGGVRISVRLPLNAGGAAAEDGGTDA